MWIEGTIDSRAGAGSVWGPSHRRVPPLSPDFINVKSALSSLACGTAHPKCNFKWKLNQNRFRSFISVFCMLRGN